MRQISNSYKTIFAASMVALTLSGCGTRIAPAPKEVGSAILQTRAALLPTCPASELEAERESAVGTAVLAALIPAAIDVGLGAVGTALNKAAEEDIQTFNARTVGRFYKARLQDKTVVSSAYHLVERKQNGCLVVVRGHFAEGFKGAAFKDEFFQDPGVQDKLKNVFGAADDPWFYYEGQLIYSSDGTAFRVQTATIKYHKRLLDGGNGKRSLGIAFTFSKPGSDVGGTAFAAGSIIADARMQTGLELTERQANGGPDPTDPLLTGVSTGLGTGWMPLPALSTLNDTVFQSANNNWNAFAASRSEVFERIKDVFGEETPDIVEAQKKPGALADWIEQDLKDSLIKRQDNNDALLKLKISRKAEILRQTNDGLLKAAEDEWIERTNPSKVMAKQRKLGDKEKVYDGNIEIGKINEEIVEITEKLTMIKEILAAPKIFRQAANDAEVAERRFQALEPFTVTVTLTEKKEANEVAKFFADIFSKANEGDAGLAAVLKQQLDPVARKKAEDEAKDREETRQDEIATKRAEAINAVLDVGIKESEVNELAADASASTKATKAKELRNAKLTAENKCQKLARLHGIRLLKCGPYL